VERRLREAATGCFDWNRWWTNQSWDTPRDSFTRDDDKDDYNDIRATRSAPIEVSEYRSPVATFFAGRQGSHDLGILRELKHLGACHPYH
jgi:hypothetical protein